MGNQNQKTANVTIGKGSLSGHYISILKAAGEASGNYNILVTSTARTPYDQARIMFENLEKNGTAKQESLYLSPGREVITLYKELKEQKKNKGEIVFAMEQKIKYLGPETVSRHCSDKGNVADVSISALVHPQEFLRSITPKVAKVIDEKSSNGCFHIEF